MKAVIIKRLIGHDLFPLYAERTFHLPKFNHISFAQRIAPPWSKLFVIEQGLICTIEVFDFKAAVGARDAGVAPRDGGTFGFGGHIYFNRVGAIGIATSDNRFLCDHRDAPTTRQREDAGWANRLRRGDSLGWHCRSADARGRRRRLFSRLRFWRGRRWLWRWRRCDRRHRCYHSRCLAGGAVIQRCAA